MHDDYEPATIYKCVNRVARRWHECSECHHQIAPGDRYDYITVLFDKHWLTAKHCEACTEIGKYFFSGGRTIDALWDTLEEQLYPGMDDADLRKYVAKLSHAAGEKLTLCYRTWRNER